MAYSIDSTTDRCYEGTTCLINKLDIRDEQKLSEAEAAIVFGKLTMLKQTPVQGVFDFEHYKQLHHFLFCDIYDWAGQIRDINLSKKGTDFVAVDQINACAKACFQRLQSFHAEELSRRELAEEVADFYHTINMLHPFREGNGRVQRAFFGQWVEERLGCSLNLTSVDADEFMIATIFAAQGVKDQLINCFETMLQPLEIDMGMHMF
ncbi:MAG: Fic family protein [Clostridia bacterium]|nr:Fic family protein [Clostridia bacterium]